MASVEYDPSCNALYVRIRKGKVAESEPVSDNVIIDLDDKDRILGIEILGSNPIDLKRFPRAKVLAK